MSSILKAIRLKYYVDIEFTGNAAQDFDNTHNRLEENCSWDIDRYEREPIDNVDADGVIVISSPLGRSGRNMVLKDIGTIRIYLFYTTLKLDIHIRTLEDIDFIVINNGKETIINLENIHELAKMESTEPDKRVAHYAIKYDNITIILSDPLSGNIGTPDDHSYDNRFSIYMMYNNKEEE